MLQKTPRPAFWKFVKGSAVALFAIEAVLFAGSYGLWYRMNTNREFRQYINDNCPYLLETYYKVGEFLGDSHQRELDLAVRRSLNNKPE